MTKTQHNITSAYWNGKVSFKFWAWAMNALDKVQRLWDEITYDEVVKKFDMELKSERKSS